MKSIKAIIAGCLFIIVVILFLQLAYIFIAVAYNALAKNYHWLNDISGSFRYLIGIPVFMITMFFGGLITANIVKTNVLLHCLAVGFITAGGMLFSALENNSLTTTGIIVFILALISTAAGGLYWQNANKTKDV